MSDSKSREYMLAGHRIDAQHDCFAMNCKGMRHEIESLRSEIAELDRRVIPETREGDGGAARPLLGLVVDVTELALGLAAIDRAGSNPVVAVRLYAALKARADRRLATTPVSDDTEGAG